MAQIRDQYGLSMRRLYSMYPTKADLITAWVPYRHHMWLGGFRARVARHIDGGIAPVDAVFEGLEEWTVETNFRGCGFVNAHAAGQGLTEEHSEIIRTHKATVADYLGTAGRSPGDRRVPTPSAEPGRNGWSVIFASASLGLCRLPIPIRVIVVVVSRRGSRSGTVCGRSPPFGQHGARPRATT